jgi:hypothetical protein
LESLLKIQVGVFSYFLRDFAINGIPFLHSAAFICDNPTLFRRPGLTAKEDPGDDF